MPHRFDPIRRTVRAHRSSRNSETDAIEWKRSLPIEAEPWLAEIADWGPNEDWSDWADALRSDQA